MTVFVQLTSSGANTGPFMIYSDVDGYVIPYGIQISAAALTAGINLVVPDGTSNIKIKSNGRCLNEIYVITPTTTTTTSTTTTTTTTTTCAPQEFVMQFNRVSSFSATDFIISSAPFSIIWDENNPITSKENFAGGPTSIAVSHNYGIQPYTGNVKIVSCDLTTLTYFNFNPSTIVASPPSGEYAITILGSELIKLDGLTWCTIQGFSGGSVYLKNANITDLSPVMGTFATTVNNMDGDIANMPVNMTAFYVYGVNTLHGNLANLPDSPDTLTTVEVTGNNYISGNIGDMPSTIVYMIIFGANTIGGSLADITNVGMIALRLLGLNRVYGDLADLIPNYPTLNTLGFGGNTSQAFVPGGTGGTTSQFTGDIDNLPALPTINGGDGIRPFRNDMYLFQFLYGYNDFVGDIERFSNCTQLAFLEITGNGITPGHGNQISGNLVDAPHNGMVSFLIGGRNTLSGNLNTYGVCPSLAVWTVGGENTISGDLADAPVTVRQFELGGNNTITTYTSASRSVQPGAPAGCKWAGNANTYFGTPAGCMIAFSYGSAISTGLTVQAELNQLLIDLDVQPTWVSNAGDLRGVAIKSGLSATGAGATALTSLDGKCTPGNGAQVFS